MNKKLLLQFIKLTLDEAHLARVPNQLVSIDDQNTDKDEKDVNEFCGVGGASGGNIQGFTLPLGATPDSHNKKRNKKRK